MEKKSGKSTASAVFGILSLVTAVVGGITWGVIGASAAALFGIIAVITGIGAKKESDGRKGTAGFVCGILGIVFAAFFGIGCSVCGSGTKGYGCYGACGAATCIGKDVTDASGSIYDFFK